LVHSVNVPVLVARAAREKSPDEPFRILMACENLAAGRVLTKTVSQFTWPTGSTGQLVSVVHTVLPGKIPDWLMKRKRSVEVEELIAHWTQHQQAELDRARTDLVSLAASMPSAFQSIEPLVKEGHVDQEIIEAAKQQKSDLIVLGAKTSSAVSRWLLGSTTDSVLNGAECSVLVVHEQA
jgi:nucleotide-binding universal stress UspA family protein